MSVTRRAFLSVFALPLLPLPELVRPPSAETALVVRYPDAWRGTSAGRREIDRLKRDIYRTWMNRHWLMMPDDVNKVTFDLRLRSADGRYRRII